MNTSLNINGGGSNDVDDEMAYNNIATIVDAWENIARMIEKDDDSEFLLYYLQ